MNCDKVMETVKSNDADVLCVLDARMDPHKKRYMGGYLQQLRKHTGKVWRGKIEPRPGRHTGCLIGGEVTFYSEHCSGVIKKPLTAYGTSSLITLIWKGMEIRIISVYRPYEAQTDAEGSLRAAVLKNNEDFEESLWEKIMEKSPSKTIIGGDFNLSEADIDTRIAGSTFRRIQYVGGGIDLPERPQWQNYRPCDYQL